MMHVWRFLALLLILGLDMLVSASRRCIAEMMTCTRQMAHDIGAAKNKTMLCGLMDAYISCIECSCNVSLTQCDLNNARTLIANSLKNYGLQCELYLPHYDEQCNLSITVTAASTSLAVCVAVYFCYMLSLRRR